MWQSSTLLWHSHDSLCKLSFTEVYRAEKRRFSLNRRETVRLQVHPDASNVDCMNSLCSGMTALQFKTPAAVSLCGLRPAGLIRKQKGRQVLWTGHGPNSSPLHKLSSYNAAVFALQEKLFTFCFEYIKKKSWNLIWSQVKHKSFRPQSFVQLAMLTDSDRFNTSWLFKNNILCKSPASWISALAFVFSLSYKNQKYTGTLKDTKQDTDKNSCCETSWKQQLA